VQPETALELATSQLTRVRQEIGKIIVGQQDVVDGVLICMLAGGHVLLEGVPGLGKTTLLRTLSQVLNLKYSRIQFTPDLMPADIVGSMIIDTEGGAKNLRFQPGPIFAHLVLADEINRATPKTQSALLEAMQEHTVTTGTQTHILEPPFLVMATQNPIEMEGTYPLPEAQLDRFMLKIQVGYPTRDEEKEILWRMSGGREIPISPVAEPGEVIALRSTIAELYMDQKIVDYIVDIVRATREPVKVGLHDVKALVAYGASPRASIYLAQAARAHAFLRGRAYVVPEDVKAMAPDVLRHRVLLTFEAEAEDVTSDGIIAKILEAVDVP